GRRGIARNALIVASLARVSLAFSGEFIFNFFGISINGLRIVGGFLFSNMGYELMQARRSRLTVTQTEVDDSEVDDISVTPLAIPMICGPGVITNSIVLMKDADGAEFKIVLVAIMLIICLLTFVILLSSGKILGFLGSTG